MFECEACGHRPTRWVGRCPRCDGWGTIAQVAASLAAPTGAAPAVAAEPLSAGAEGDPERILTGLEGVDRVLGGGLVAGSVVLLAGEPGIGKSTLALQVAGALAAAGRTCLLASGEESRAAGRRPGRAGRGLAPTASRSSPGRDLGRRGRRRARVAAHGPRGRLASRRCARPGSTARPGRGRPGPGVHRCPRRHGQGGRESPSSSRATSRRTATWQGRGRSSTRSTWSSRSKASPRSGLRVLAAGKNRFGAEGETAWFEMGTAGLARDRPHRPARLRASAPRRRGRARPAGPPRARHRGPGARRPRRGLRTPARHRPGPAAAPAGHRGPRPCRAWRSGAATSSGRRRAGVRLDDPACDLAVAAAVASAATGVAPPAGCGVRGRDRPHGEGPPGPRDGAAAPGGARGGVHIGLRAGRRRGRRRPTCWSIPVTQVGDALGWALSPAPMRPRSLPA